MPSRADYEADLTAARTAIDRLLDPLICRTPAYGAPGYAHCAACCYNTGFAATSMEELRMAEALHSARLAIDAYTGWSAREATDA